MITSILLATDEVAIYNRARLLSEYARYLLYLSG